MEFAYKVFVTLTTLAVSLPASIPFPVASTSNEIPFLSFAALLQSSGSVAFPFQLLSYSFHTAFQEMFPSFLRLFCGAQGCGLSFQGLSALFSWFFLRLLQVLQRFSAFTFTNLLFTNCVIFRGKNCFADLTKITK